jgi:plasmid stability protein
MATLYVENIPDDLYAALREQARQNRKSIAAEVTALLEQTVVTPSEMRARGKFLSQAKALRSKPALTSRQFPSAEEMQREDRQR